MQVVCGIKMRVSLRHKMAAVFLAAVLLLSALGTLILNNQLVLYNSGQDLAEEQRLSLRIHKTADRLYRAATQKYLYLASGNPYYRALFRQDAGHIRQELNSRFDRRALQFRNEIELALNTLEAGMLEPDAAVVRMKTPASFDADAMKRDTREIDMVAGSLRSWEQEAARRVRRRRDQWEADSRRLNVSCALLGILLLGTLCLTYVVYRQDLARRSMAEEARWLASARERALLDVIPDTMFVLSREGTFLSINAPSQTPTALQGQSPTGKHVSDLLPPAIAEEFLRAIQEALQTAQTRSVEYALPAKGEYRTMECRLITSDRERGQVLAIVRDITERRKAEEEARTHLRAMEDYSARLQAKTEDLERSQAELQAKNLILEKIALIDALTALYNHRAFYEQLEREVQKSMRYVVPLSLILLDVDHFKELNDTFGHLAGDAALKRMAALLLENARRSDMVARYGGEEFAVILPNTDRDGAVVIAERFRQILESASWPDRNVTASFGIASLAPGISDRQRLIREADAALYAAKQQGRNTVVHYHTLLAAQALRKMEGEHVSRAEVHR